MKRFDAKSIVVILDCCLKTQWMIFIKNHIERPKAETLLGKGNESCQREWDEFEAWDDLEGPHIHCKVFAWLSQHKWLQQSNS